MRTRTRTLGVIGTVVGLAGASVAFAAWTAGGTGAAPATAETSAPLTVTVDGVSGLYPRGSVSVGFTVKNSNPYAVTLQDARPGNIRVDAQHASCNTASVTGATVTLSDRLAPGQTSARHDAVLTMSADANDACQGATFTFDLRVSGTSS